MEVLKGRRGVKFFWGCDFSTKSKNMVKLVEGFLKSIEGEGLKF